MMNSQIFIAAALAVVLVVGIVGAVQTVQGDSNQVKQSNKANVHIKNDGGGDATGAVSQSNTNAQQTIP